MVRPGGVGNHTGNANPPVFRVALAYGIYEKKLCRGSHGSGGSGVESAKLPR